MNIITGPGIINVPGDQWDEVVAFYTQQLGAPTSNDGSVAIWRQGDSELQLIRNNTEAFIGQANVFVGLNFSPNGGSDINVLPLYAGNQGQYPYAIALVSLKVRSKLFQGELEYGVIYNPPY